MNDWKMLGQALAHEMLPIGANPFLARKRATRHGSGTAPGSGFDRLGGPILREPPLIEE
jgi:hypothetical protein